MMRAALSIVSHGHGPLLHALLADLEQQQGIEHCQIIVTLNLADEALDPAAYPRLALTLVRNPTPKGFGANHNAAFEHCRAPWFVVINPDIRLPDPQTFSRLLSAAPGAACGLRAPLVVNSAGTPEDSIRPNLSLSSLLARRFGRRGRVNPRGLARRGAPFYWLAGMFLATDSAAFRAIGGFDTRYFLYCEDYDLCARLYLAGYSLEVCEDVRVIHDAQRDSHRSAKHLRWHVSSVLKVWLSLPFWKIVAVG